MKKIWIIVANAGQSKVYRAESSQLLVEHALFFNDESHSNVHELVSDKQGREANPIARKGWNTNTYEPKTDIKDKVALSFANTLVQFFEEKLKAGECERIYLIVKPPFLSCLKDAMPPNIAKLIHEEIHKDLTHLSPKEILEYLPPAL